MLYPTPPGYGATSDPQVKRIPDWFAYMLVVVVGITVLLVSSYYLWHLALAIGMPKQLAWTLPVALDAGAAGATVCWVGAQSVTARVWGRGIALSALAGTVLGNALAHLIDFKLVSVTPLLVILTGAVYPAVLWAMVHLALVLRAERPSLTEPIFESITQPDHDEPVIHQEPSPVIEPTPIKTVTVDASRDVPVKPSPKRRQATPADRRKWIASQLDAGRDVSGGDVERQFGSKNGAREVAQVKAQRTLVGVS